MLKQGFQQDNQLQKIITILYSTKWGNSNSRILIRKSTIHKKYHKNANTYVLNPENSKLMHTLCVLFSALLNSFTYTSKQLQTLDFTHQMNMNWWKNNTLTAFNNSQQQSFIQAWKASEKLKKTHLKARRNEDVQKFQQEHYLRKMEI